MTTETPPERVTLAGVYALVDGRTDKMLAEMRTLENEFRTYVRAHEDKHEAEEFKNSSRVRWAVTTLGTLILGTAAIVVPIINSK